MREQLEKQIVESKASHLEQKLDKCKGSLEEEVRKNKSFAESLAREHSRQTNVKKQMRNEWERNNEIRDELSERFRDVEKLQGALLDEMIRRTVAEENAESLKRQLQGEIDNRKFVERELEKEMIASSR